MRDMVAVCAILGGIIQIIAAIGGPQAAGVGSLGGDPAPAMETGPLLLGIAGGLLSIVGGSLVSIGRSGRLWGLAIILVAVGTSYFVGPWTGWYIIASGIAAIGGVLALFVGPERGPAG